ncbi:MAG TPA: DUF885 family protein, partial [Thermoanaerobaculia bacterium]|nr:DUF885 family protein [Thermoanaerobaculia bacterium]
MRSRHLAATAAAILLSGVALPAAAPPAAELAEQYLERYLTTFPSRATAAGRHDLDDRLEDLSAPARAAWIDYNRETLAAARSALAASPAEPHRLDLELLARQAGLELLRWETLRLPERDPLFWTGIAATADTLLLMRDDRPAAERLAAAAARAEQLPRLAAQAREALSRGGPQRIAPQLTLLAAGQARAAAGFYAESLPGAAQDEAPALRLRLQAAGGAGAGALEGLADFLDDLASRASGSFRSGDAYPKLFALYTGLDETPQQVLAQALDDLAAKRSEAAAFGRSAWRELMGPAPPPADDAALLRSLFAHIEDQHAASVEELVQDYRHLAAASLRFVRERDLVTVPDPFALWIGTSPDSFVGQGVGGVYPPGPWSPEATTLLFLPTPPGDAPPAARDRLFRAFNHPFNVMIVPHELVPGHALQLARAARHPHRVRALFPDDVYVEGWGTFCERLMLDLGWGDSAARVAHLKKQLENIARTVVDIRVHAGDAGEDEVLRFVQEEALQDEQLA